MGQYFGKIPPNPDGTEGYASITLTLKEPYPEIKTIACIIKNDRHLQELQSKNHSDLYVRTHKETKFFLYFFCSESDLSNRLVETRIVAHRFTKPKKDKVFTIQNKEGTKPFFVRGNHVFLPACHKNIIKDFNLFLKDHSKAVTWIENLSVGKKYRGVKKSNALVKYHSLSLSRRNNTFNITKPAGIVLIDGPLLFEEASERWSLIGWYKNATEEDQITVYPLNPQDTKTKTSTRIQLQPDGRMPNQRPPNTSGSFFRSTSTTSQPNPTGSTGPRTSLTNSKPNTPGSTGPPTSLTNSKPNPNYQALQDLLNEDRVLDCLAIHLDIDYKSKYKNWKQLADEMKAPQDIKDKCKCNTVHSPTLTLLDRPDIQNKTIEELMNVTANITYVSKFLKEKFPGAEDRSKSIKEGLCCNPNLKDAFATKLDRQLSRVRKNWRDIGSLLGIDEDDLDLIEKGGHNPAEKLLLNAYKSLSTEKTKAKEFRRIIMGFEKRNDLHDLLVKWEITENDDRPLKNVIPPYSENMKEMTAALNRCPPGLKNWKNLASSWNCDSDQFDYPAEQSPTNTLLEWVRDSMDHEVTVDEFLNILGDRMKRYDVKRDLEKLIKKN